MNIDEILKHDFGSESDLKVLKEVIKNLQDYCIENAPKVEWHSLFDNIDDVFKEEWEDDWMISEGCRKDLLFCIY